MTEASDADMATYSKDPHTNNYASCLEVARSLIRDATVGNMHGLDGKAERRVLRLINPAYQEAKE